MDEGLGLRERFLGWRGAGGGKIEVMVVEEADGGKTGAMVVD